ncbi:MAG TPA: glycosyltransferase [Henriciella marina]|uniref:glycosyltransferase family 2 protein n=1 Tax=Henriciella sp. TaxID=1968823 RepID=UPI0017B574AD|nr:glycosyltransferase family 2 protein [Henriciella sp.]HIG23287.1 glycosyltransferase [Henriciella sp.]HIK64544.1 glycosyltransferase [Henriciella marina]
MADCDLMTLSGEHMSKAGLAPGEEYWSNGKPGASELTVCVPCYRYDASSLVADLSAADGAERAGILIYDDGSGDPQLTARLKTWLGAYPGYAHLVTASDNLGRAHARNRLYELSESDWILFLDADMKPDDGKFIERYLSAIQECDGPALIAGGFSLEHAKVTAATRLHAAQSLASECLAAAERRKEPGRYVFTSNILVHRRVLADVAFDDGFKGWGWEDVDWGLNVANAYPVRHIDNTATHLGLDDTDTLLSKFGSSGQNFARLAQRHPDAVKSMPLYRIAYKFRNLPARRFLQGLARFGARSATLPDGLRLACLKTYRALAYSMEIQ